MKKHFQTPNCWSNTYYSPFKAAGIMQKINNRSHILLNACVVIRLIFTVRGTQQVLCFLSAPEFRMCKNLFLTYWHLLSDGEAMSSSNLCAWRLRDSVWENLLSLLVVEIIFRGWSFWKVPEMTFSEKCTECSRSKTGKGGWRFHRWLCKIA